MVWTIYVHTHVESGRRYIGLTSQTMEKRWKNHVCASKSSKGGRWHFPNAIRKYGPQAFSHEVLEIHGTLEAANAAEERLIEKFKTRDPQFGFNLTKGGGFKPNPEKKNPWNDPEFGKRVSASLKERNQDPAYKALRSEISQEVLSRPEVRRKLSEATRSQFSTPDSRAVQSERAKALHALPDFTETSMAGFRRHNACVAAKTHCKHGHEFTPENTRVDGNGWRYCRKCASVAVCKRQFEARTHCAKGHEFVEGSHGLSEDGRRICSLCSVTHCLRGHEFTPENTAHDGKGSRVCLECRRLRGRESDARRRQKRREFLSVP